ncbi:MAG: hypothetical protein A2487_14610 [Candidatus Raymondbacteria bacterium RifOxyC12_full_50_8]|uniref:Lipocalin-like domain-containing protein n=1 Tax=Candidatus Raymondbacteria bacterium RIFOXYD12_FULL_49_13 TaxID=1817890 RepID=A0A1F7F6L7_UNCRA|nr:MAG: hypothetical protein A2248_03560 [Candidatus Raymondbacteria bacterium RIFOXYA2_FULL_49_16]OGJ99655.1 MAG: hypothetical protein A2350_16215 [Candidatus Raymondbacteria bacterium RifOxyB12_full_50_8]OGK02146.1 MAG: hypothetical protein A2519_18975 [Candidatus Raymondbacteria bacterium RIFOXYD12_FULL_49_13]OGK06872.1 MAG: hypothetical protein A2487_14610 [Candidatus Raymondbacteria bacterium RifOxyC12_full_50_8]OGP42531.1 MAG: hypothetical protein A2324_17595 [Candidatus Raymondbacteria b
MAEKKNLFIGKWRITEMEQWDQDFVDEEEEGFIEFGKRSSFQFGYLQGQIDYKIEEIEGKQRLEFSWAGNDEMDPVSGRGWARIEEDGTLYGKIAFHMGDQSWFKSKRKK